MISRLLKSFIVFVSILLTAVVFLLADLQAGTLEWTITAYSLILALALSGLWVFAETVFLIWLRYEDLSEAEQRRVCGLLEAVSQRLTEDN